MGLFSEKWFYPISAWRWPPDLETLWQDLQSDIIQQVIAQPQVVVHRDFHSRNLMVLNHSDELGVIDFQRCCHRCLYLWFGVFIARCLYQLWWNMGQHASGSLSPIGENWQKLGRVTVDFNIMVCSAILRYWEFLYVCLSRWQRPLFGQICLKFSMIY